MTAQGLDFSIPTALRDELRQWRTRSATVGAVAFVLLIIGAFLSPTQFFRSYLWSYIFYLGLAVGPLAWVMVQYLTGGAWGTVIRRPCEAATRTIPLIALLFIPIAIGIPYLYQWSHPDIVAADAALRHKQPYLNVPFFLARTALYFGGWMFFAWWMNRWSAVEDQDGGAVARRKMVILAGPGLLFWGFAVTRGFRRWRS